MTTTRSIDAGLGSPSTGSPDDALGLSLADLLAARADGTPLTVVVVGNGMVSHRFCEKLRAFDAARAFRLRVIGEEPRPAYDRVHLTSYFADRAADKLLLGTHEWYASNGIELLTGTRVVSIDREGRAVLTSAGERVAYDVLVLATGSSAFVPPMPGIERKGVFVYRTIEDLDGIIDHATSAKRAAVIGGGLLGLEAARAVHDAGLETHVIEVAPRLMPRQLDAAASALLEKTIRELGVHVHVDRRPTSVVAAEDGAASGLEFSDGETLDVDMIVVSAGIRPRDELAKQAGIALGPRGGVVVDDGLRTSDPSIFAIGEVALHRDVVYGLVAPGYEMAEALAKNLVRDLKAAREGEASAFRGGDLSAKLKLLGTDVATFGDPFQDPKKSRTICFEDQVRGIYKKLVLGDDGKRLLGGILVGDASDYGRLLHLTRSSTELADPHVDLGFGGGAAAGGGALPDEAQVCSCNNVSVKDVRFAIREGELGTLAQVKACTKAGTGCGGCLPMVTDILHAELAASGRAVKPVLCEHFAYSRAELYQVVASTRIETFAELIARYGKGLGCEICKPAAASIFASIANEPVLKKEHRTLQDTNDRFLANIQKNGTYSVVPRVAGGEITPDQLIVLGQVAKRYGLYTKITGGQRVDLFGAHVGDLPAIWEELIAGGFETGHAYGKSLRTVKSCVGSTWCRYGVGDSTAFAIMIENRYKGLRSPHKLKSAVSGCVRECAEAQSKDFGLIATEKGWNLYVCGNGGASPRHADLLASDIDQETVVRYLDRFLMFYVRTADRLTRTSVWLEKMEGGIEHLKKVVCEDSLGIAADLEAQMQHLIATYECEWTGVLKDPERRALFKHFANDPAHDETVAMVPERGQVKPAPRTFREDPLHASKVRRLPVFASLPRAWVQLAQLAEVPEDGGIAVRYGSVQLALFRVAGNVYATQNMCPHKREMVLARGIVGDQAGIPKVACPLHKKTFDLGSGACLSGDELEIATFPARVDEGRIVVELPPVEELVAAVTKADDDCATRSGCSSESTLPAALAS